MRVQGSRRAWTGRRLWGVGCGGLPNTFEGTHRDTKKPPKTPRKAGERSAHTDRIGYRRDENHAPTTVTARGRHERYELYERYGRRHPRRRTP